MKFDISLSILQNSMYSTSPALQNGSKRTANVKNAVIVSPDDGGVKRVTSIAINLELPFAMIHKDRSQPGTVSRMTFTGEVASKTAILVDDMVDTCGTFCTAVVKFREAGA